MVFINIESMNCFHQSHHKFFIHILINQAGTRTGRIIKQSLGTALFLKKKAPTISMPIRFR